MMQIEIYNPTQGEPLQPIKWNFDELKNWVEEGLKKYENMVYTPDTIAIGKKDRADLNKLSKAIDDKRKDMKKMYLAPYEEFEHQAKTLTGLIDAQSAKIDAQVKEFEQAEKDDKQAEIMAVYEEAIGDLKELIPYDRIHDKKWLNKTIKLETVKEAIETLVSRVKTAFTAINTMGFDEQTTNRVKAAYLRNFDLADAMAEKEKIEVENKRLAEYEARKKAQETEARRQQAKQERQEQQKIEPKQPEPVEEPAPEQPVQIDFRVVATKAQLMALKEFMNNNGIEFGMVPKQ